MLISFFFYEFCVQIKVSSDATQERQPNSDEIPSGKIKEPEEIEGDDDDDEVAENTVKSTAQFLSTESSFSCGSFNRELVRA